MTTSTLKERKDRAVYGPGPLYRSFMAFFAILLTFPMISSFIYEGFTPASILPVLVVLLLYFAVFYRDSWIFDTKERKITSVWGVGPFVKKRTYSFDEIRTIEITHFLKGIPTGSQVATKSSWRHPSQIVLSLVKNDEDETRLDIEIAKERTEGARLQREASRLAALTGIDLKMDRDTYNTRKL